jgi:hypothetical protein
MSLSCLLLILTTVFAAPAPTSTFGWREVLSVLGFLSPIVFGIIAYLLKKKADAERELQKARLKELSTQHTTALKELRDHVDNTLRDIEATYKAQLATSDSSLAQHKEELTRLERQIDALSTRVQTTAQANLEHQNACTARYVERSVYAQDTAAQKDHLRTIRELINQQIETVEKLARL